LSPATLRSSGRHRTPEPLALLLPPPPLLLPLLP
jgi:hypothetical protein